MNIIIQKTRKQNSCFNENKRFLLECYLGGKGGFPKITSKTKLCEIFSCDRKTIYNEIKRGTVEHLTSALDIILVYNAENAQIKADFENTARGAKLKIGSDKILCEHIRKLILVEHYSPYAVVQKFNNEGWPTQTRISEKTLYNYVNEEVIEGIKKEDLPNKGVKYKKKGSKKRYSKSICALKSITTRPEEVETRKTFGHWEIDTVKGKINGSTECLFTMTERKSRKEIVIKVPDAKAESIVSALNVIEDKMSFENFRKTFVTLTSDGGSEFFDAQGIEKSATSEKARTSIYYAHPYSAFERGTNEVHNRLLRRFFPKGTDFKTVSIEEIAKAVDWMNTYPRKILGGKTPDMIFEEFWKEIIT